MESLGILGEENSDEVYDKFSKDIAFDGDRYTVKLPWKTYNKVLPDNFKLSQGRLNSLIKRLRKTPQRLKEYDEIIRKQEARFGTYKYALTSDIKSAFLNIRVEPEDRVYLRFLWVEYIEDLEPEVVVKRFSSGFCLVEP